MIVAPRSGLFDAHMFPPCDRTMDRQIARPSPSPFFFDVTKGSNTDSSEPAAIPIPRSCTAIRTTPSSTDVAITRTRSPGGVSSIASHAFMIKFSNTCCSCTRSA